MRGKVTKEKHVERAKMALNDICFTQPHWRLIAEGFDTERWFEDGQGVGTGGMFSPQRDHLKTSQFYYRFANSTSPRKAQLGGGWWISFETYNTIKLYAQRNNLEFTYAARLFLALPYEWTRVDRLVRAMLVEPMDAYVGQGKVASDKSGGWTPVQHIKVLQLYIPGLIASTNANDLYETVWSNVSFMYAHNQAPV
jgi:hypothetical protein